MRFLFAFVLLLPFCTYASHADIYLYDQPHCATIVGGYVCRNIEDGHCCFKQNRLWKSVRVISPIGNDEWIEPYSKQREDYCAITLNNDPGPGCFDDSDYMRITGAFWFENPDIGGFPTHKRARSFTQVEADIIFLVMDGLEYRLDSDSAEGREYQGLTTQSAKEAFMKEHSNSIMPSRL